MGKLKDIIGDVVVERLAPFGNEFEKVREDEGYLRDVAAQGRRKARYRAGVVMEEVRRVVGLERI